MQHIKGGEILKNNKGSLTVEATISMIFFLTAMLLFLLFIKISIVEYSLQNIASEATKRIASSSYIFQTIQNQFNYAEPEDEADKDNRYGKEIAKIAIKDVGGGIFNIFTGNLLEGDSAKKLTKIQGGSVKMGVDLIFSAGSLVLKSDAMQSTFFSKKRDMQDKILKEVVEGTSDLNSFVDTQKIIVEYVKYPESSSMFSARKSNDIYKNIGIDAGSYLEKEDVMVVLSYPFEMNLPFVGKQKFIITKTAIEHAWLYGGNGITAKSEGLISKLISEATNIALYGFTDVKITNNGNYYHRSSCSNLNGEYASNMRKYNAMKQGFKACSVCSP